MAFSARYSSGTKRINNIVSCSFNVQVACITTRDCKPGMQQCAGEICCRSYKNVQFCIGAKPHDRPCSAVRNYVSKQQRRSFSSFHMSARRIHYDTAVSWNLGAVALELGDLKIDWNVGYENFTNTVSSQIAEIYIQSHEQKVTDYKKLCLFRSIKMYSWLDAVTHDLRKPTVLTDCLAVLDWRSSSIHHSSFNLM